ncbi:NAD-dependent epimerase/dehydratase family protein [Roseomonas sp. CCTCC AB2023176]|uniref:NAD-dependent epimerase/dehydratase family protein n=1 Tax=Roseomonas sp. CCTCC AB2023176 TaxID=3342640 RepID=UPI0035D5A47B
MLVTGAAGFVGLNVVEALLRRGDAVTAFGLEELPERASSLFATLPGTLRTVRGDVRDAGALREAAAGAEGILPFAAITAGAEREAANPESVLEVNLLGLIGTLRAGQAAGTVRRVILPSSSAVYGESAYRLDVLDEVETPPVPITTYGVTKYAAERMGLRLCGLWGLDAVAARIGPAFGPWERATGARDTLSPFFALGEAARDGKTVVLPDGNLPAYDWIYAPDLAAGLLALLDHPAPPHRVVNLGPGSDQSALLFEVAEALAERRPAFRLSRGAEPTIRPNDPRRRGIMAVDRARDFGWQARRTGRGAANAYADWLGGA